MLKIVLIASCLAVPIAAAFGDPVKLNMQNQPGVLVNALAALDQQSVLIDQSQSDGTTKKVKVDVAYDFGKDSVRIRLAIRKDLLALRDASEAYETSRSAAMKSVFGVGSMPEDEFNKQPADKVQIAKDKLAPLMHPTAVELALFLPEDIETFARAGVPSTVSATLDPLFKKK